MEMTTQERALYEGVKKAVADRGEDWEYPSAVWDEENQRHLSDEWHKDAACVYRKPDGTPACIVGFAMAEAYGVDEVPVYASPAEEAYDVLDGRDGLSDEFIICMNVAQQDQDMGQPWGTVLANFKDELGLRGYTDVD